MTLPTYDAANQRLEWARRRRYDTQAAFARRVGVSPSSYSAYENGKRGLTWRNAERFASALGVDAWWLFKGEQLQLVKPAPSAGIPIDFHVGAGAEVAPFDEGPLDTIEWSDFSGLHGAIVVGNSMAPSFLDRDIIIFDPAKRLSWENLLHRTCIAQVKDGPRLLKILERGSAPHLFDLIPINEESPAVIDVEIDWVGPIRKLIRTIR